MGSVTDGQVAGEVLLAHPIAVLAIPAFIPVVVIVVTILWVARKDRLEAAAEVAGAEHAVDGAVAQSTSQPVAEPVLAAPVRTAEPSVEQGERAAEEPEPRRSWRDRLPRLVIGDEE